MINIEGKKGAWINQYAQPNMQTFYERASQVSYLIIKYGLSQFEQSAATRGIPWLGERMGEAGVGLVAIDKWSQFASELAQQCNQPGCVGGVINLEEADGGWHNDDGSRTNALVAKFRALCPDKPLYASIDTRGPRPQYAYQQVLAQLCDGVMPMVYPKAFGQTAQGAVGSAITPMLRGAWKNKPIIPTIQTYDNLPPAVVEETMFACGREGVRGITAYTLGHATQPEWGAFINTAVAMGSTGDDLRTQLLDARVKFLEAMLGLALRGTPDEILAFATYWKQASK